MCHRMARRWNGTQASASQQASLLLGSGPQLVLVMQLSFSFLPDVVRRVVSSFEAQVNRLVRHSEQTRCWAVGPQVLGDAEFSVCCLNSMRV